MRASSIQELGTDGEPRYHAGAQFVHFCASPLLWGVLLWGRPGRQDARDLVRSLVRELEPGVAPHASIIDAGGLTGADIGAFEELTEYVRAHFDALARAVTRVALVRPPGMEGAVVAGIYHVMPRPYPVEIFDDVHAAMGWLAAHDPRLGELEQTLPAELQRLSAEGVGTVPIVHALRAHLEANLTTAEVDAAASALGLSRRTLQRRLEEANTTFHAELAQARIAVAQRWMLESDASLTAIALEVGCASLQHFSALFRRHTGQSPSAWREQHLDSAERGRR